MPTADQIRDALKVVIDPELRHNIVDLGMVRSIELPEPGRVDIVMSLTTPGCPVRAHFEKAIKGAVIALEGVEQANVGFDVLSGQEKSGLQQRLGRRDGLPTGALAAVKNIICVGSGKGGVGKSTVTANLAAALTLEGKHRRLHGRRRVGLLDPAHARRARPPAGLAAAQDPATGGRRRAQGDLDRALPRREDQAITWRGPMLHKAIRQFLEDVDWGELDYLLIDLPPGTGDVSMTLAQLLPQAQFVVVTTPQPAAQKVAKRAAETANRFDLSVTGVIENMSGFTTPSGERFTIFGEGGGQELADELDVPLLGKIPLQEELREAADQGMPLVFQDPDAPASQALLHAARGLIAATPQELPMLQQPLDTGLAPPPAAAPVTGTALPMAT